jgi:hypothetical protein
MIGDAGDDVGEPGLGVDVVEATSLDERVKDRGPTAARVRRDVMMPGVWAARLSSPIRSIRFSGSPPLSSPIRCMAALVI